MKKNYIDLFLLPLPKKNLGKHKNVAQRFGKMARQYGALDYREFIGDDLFPKGTLSFSKAAKPKRSELVISAVISYKSRAHREQVMKKMFKGPRMRAMMKEDELTDMKKMYYGGFKTIVDV